MAKLDKATAAAADAVETQDFSALPAGTYHAKLVEVQTERNGQPLVGGNSGEPYWNWVFQVITGPKRGRKLFVTTSLGESSLWKMKQVFTALGYTTDSDTDEMINERATLAVSQRLIEQGQRKGQMGNNVDAVQEYTGPEDVEDDAELAGVGAGAPAGGGGVEF